MDSKTPNLDTLSKRLGNSPHIERVGSTLQVNYPTGCLVISETDARAWLPPAYSKRTQSTHDWCLSCGQDKEVSASSGLCNQCQTDADSNQDASDRLEADLTRYLSQHLQAWLRSKIEANENPELLECALVAFSEAMATQASQHIDNVLKFFTKPSDPHSQN